MLLDNLVSLRRYRLLLILLQLLHLLWLVLRLVLLLLLLLALIDLVSILRAVAAIVLRHHTGRMVAGAWSPLMQTTSMCLSVRSLSVLLGSHLLRDSHPTRCSVSIGILLWGVSDMLSLVMLASQDILIRGNGTTLSRPRRKPMRITNGANRTGRSRLLKVGAVVVWRHGDVVLVLAGHEGSSEACRVVGTIDGGITAGLGIAGSCRARCICRRRKVGRRAAPSQPEVVAGQITAA